MTTDLSAIAADINRHHAEAQAAAASAVEHAKQAGILLFEVKAALPHGEFLPWVAANLTVSKRQAQRYMTAAVGKPAPARIAAKPATDAPEKVKSDTMSHLPPESVDKPVDNGENGGKVAGNRPEPVDNHDDDRPTDIELLEEGQREIERLQVQIKSLTVTDTAAELAKQVAIRQAIEARLSDEMDKNHRLQRDLDAYGKWFADLRKATGLNTRAEILSAFRRMAA